MKNKIKYIIITLIILLIGFVGGGYACYKVLPKLTNVSTENKNVSITETNTIKESIDKIYDAVYVVETYDNKGNQLGTGTGFAYKNENNIGYIITNHHVIDGASIIKVVNMEGNELEAKLLGSDEYSDIAVLSISSEGILSVASLGSSTDMELGDTVFTVGSPLGIKYQGTVTKGILSGKDRQVTISVNNGNFVMDVLQTDAAINPGNSGGPLVNINGEVIGVTSLKLVQDEIEGMGFAIPIEMVTTILEDLENGKKIERPMLGIQLTDVGNAYMIRNYHINVSDDIDYGIIIMKIEDSSPAAIAGLKVGDVITKIDGEEIEDSAYFRYNLYKHKVGDTIKLTYIRDGNENIVDIKLDKSL